MQNNQIQNNGAHKYKLSIITICLNEPNVQKTCQSIVEQTNQDFEWIVIDGGSNKETQDIWDKYKSRINKFVSEKDNGIYNACNKGIRLAQGEYILLINAGDTLYNNTVIDSIFKEGLSTDIVYGSYARNGKKYKADYDKLSVNFFLINTLHTPATIVRKNLYEKYGYFDEHYKIASDFKAFVVFFKNNASYKYIPVIISDFDTNGISSQKKNDSILLKERYDIIDECFSKEEIKEGLEDPYIENSFLENIFSVKNSYKKIYKVFTVLGIKFKIKIKKYEE